MILDNSGARGDRPGATLDDLFRRAGVRNPQSVALADPPNRERFTDGPPRRLSYAEADRAISAFAARLRGLGLATDTVVAIQLPNAVDGVIALMGVLRAGMIAAPLPLLWRAHDMAPALRAAGAKAIVTCARAGSDAPVQAAMQAAADVFAIRHICCFGQDLPDGVVPLDDVFGQAAVDRVHDATRQGMGAFHVAAITFDVGPEGVRTVARNHLQLIGGGLVPFLEAAITRDSALLSTIPPASFAGIALAIVPWLLAGGMLALHQDCDPSALAAQCTSLKEATVMLPGPAVAPLGETGVLGDALKSVVALWRAPERMATAAAWRRNAMLVDVAAFGEIGLIAASRRGDGMPAPVPHGRIGAPRGAVGAVTVMETARSRSGTLMLRGPMVSEQAFATGTELNNEPAPDAAGYVDTGFPCRRDGDALMLTGLPPGVVSIGGYRYRRQALEALVTEADAGATIMAVPDGMLGDRLAGAAANRDAVRAALQARGIDRLVSEAFCPRGNVDAA